MTAEPRTCHGRSGHFVCGGVELTLGVNCTKAGMERRACRECVKAYNAARKAYNKAYRAKPEYKAYHKAYKATPEYKAYRKAYDTTPEYKAYRKAYDKARQATPEHKAYDKARMARRRAANGNLAWHLRRAGEFDAIPAHYFASVYDYNEAVQRIESYRAARAAGDKSAGLKIAELLSPSFREAWNDWIELKECCELLLGCKLTLGHPVALAEGGEHDPLTFVPMTQAFNSAQSTTPLDVYLAAHPPVFVSVTESFAGPGNDDHCTL